MTPTQRTLGLFRDMGFVCGMVERWNPHVGHHGIRQDLFGIIDIIAINPRPPGMIVGIQSTGTAFAAHKRAILTDPKKREAAMAWLSSGGELSLVGWRKLKRKRGGKAEWWCQRHYQFDLADFR